MTFLNYRLKNGYYNIAEYVRFGIKKYNANATKFRPLVRMVLESKFESGHVIQNGRSYKLRFDINHLFSQKTSYLLIKGFSYLFSNL